MGMFMKLLAAGHRLFVTSSLRVVTGPLYGSLAYVPCQYLAYAILKVAYTCPKRELKNKVCSWASSTGINNLASPKRRDAGGNLALTDAR